MGAFIFFSLAGCFFLRRFQAETETRFGFRFRIGLFFTSAIIIPASLFLYLGGNLIAAETGKLQAQATERLKRDFLILQNQFSIFDQKLAKTIQNRLEDGWPANDWEKFLLRRLDAMIEEALIGSYFFSDAKGDIAAWNDKNRNKAKQKLFSIFLKTVFCEIDVPKGGLGSMTSPLSISFGHGGFFQLGAVQHRVLIPILQKDENRSEFRSKYGSPNEILEFQNFIGPEIYWKEFLDQPNLVFRFSSFKREFLESWSWGFAFGTQPLPPGKSPGIFVKLETSCLPKDFLCRQALTYGKWEFLPSNCSVALIDDETRGNSIFRRGFPQDNGFSKKIHDASVPGENETVRIADFLISKVQVDVGKNKNFLISADLGDFFRQQRHLKAWTDFIFLGILIGIFSGFMWFTLKGRNEVSILIQTLTLLIVAIWLPTLGILWEGIVLIKELEQGDREHAFQKMRSFDSILQSQFEEFVPFFSRKMTQKLIDGFPRKPDVKAIEEFLSPLVQVAEDQQHPHWGIISKYYWTDEKGDLAASSGKFSNEEAIGVKMFLRKIFQEQVGGRETVVDLVTQTVSDLAKNMGEEAQETSMTLGHFAKLTLGRGEDYCLPCRIDFGEESHILLVDCMKILMQQHFYEFQVKEGMVHKLLLEKGNPVQFHFLPRTYTEKEFLCPVELKNSTFFSAFEFPDESTGEKNIAGNNCLYLTSAEEKHTQYRRIFTTETAPLIRKTDGRKNLLFVSFGLISVLLIFIARLITGNILLPVLTLEKAFHEVSEGNLNTSLQKVSNGEIGFVSLSFNEMVRGLRERACLQTYISETAMKAIRSANTGFDAEAQTKEISIMVSDIRNFTGLSEQYPAEIVFSMLNDYFEVVELTIRQHGGQVLKFIGDAVLAAFPEEGEKGASKAVQAALDMVGFLGQFNKKRTEKGQFAIGIGIGINTGKVLLGKVGSQKRMDFAYVGTAINAAGRLETLSKNGRFTKIIISAETYKHVKNLVQVETIDGNIESCPGTIYEITTLMPNS